MLGILGGMGPLATVDFMSKLVAKTPANWDQEHIPAIVSSVPTIPDRTTAILGHGPSPLPAMISSLRMLEGAGATLIAIPCNTAHYWFDELQASTKTTILHIVDAVLKDISSQGVSSGAIGILSTEGTRRAGIYEKRLGELPFQLKFPDEGHQIEVADAIQAVKSGNVPQAQEIMVQRVRDLLDDGCERVVMACTEIPLALANAPIDIQPYLVDATDALAVSCVTAFFGAGHEASYARSA